jgi:aspartate kinase
MIVMKFGCAALGNSDRVTQALNIVAARRDSCPIVIVSALPLITGQLLVATQSAAAQDEDRLRASLGSIRQRHEEFALALLLQNAESFESFVKSVDKHIEEVEIILRGIALLGETTPRVVDRVLAIGQKLSSLLMAHTMKQRGFPVVHVDSEEVVWTNNDFGWAKPDMARTKVAASRILLPLVERRAIPVLGGFVGRTANGATTTLGRNGSDFTATIIGAALSVEEVQLWSDVDGLFACDPRLVPNARPFDQLTFAEASELSQFGVKRLEHVFAPLIDTNVTVRVLNTYNPSSTGTIITRVIGSTPPGPRAITCNNNVTIVQVTASTRLRPEDFAELFATFTSMAIQVELLSASDTALTLTIAAEDATGELIGRLHTITDLGRLQLQVSEDQCVIAISGQDLMTDPDVRARVLESMHRIPATMVLLGRSGARVSLIVREENAGDVVRRVYRALFEEDSALYA